MHLTDIRLTNFGQYRGEHQVILQDTEGAAGVATRPIVLIGGRNGAGKTTLLEAVKLCLYGAASLGSRVRQKAYTSYLLSRIYRHPGNPTQIGEAALQVTFQHTVGTTTHAFAVCRAWQRQGQRAEESLTVSRDGRPLADHEYAWWEQFLHDLLPPGLADLFFFDGEKIQALADDPDYVVLGRAIRALLGLDLLDRLRADLSVYLARQSRGAEQGLEAQLAQLAEERRAVEEAFELAHEQLATTNRLLTHQRGRIEEEERLLASEGGDIASQREALKRRTHQLEETMRQTERAIAEQAGGLLPFAVIPTLAWGLRERLLVEEQVAHDRATRAVADELLNQVLHRLSGVDSAASQQAQVQAAFREVLGEQGEVDLAEPLHDISRREREQMVRWLAQAVEEVPGTLQALGVALEQAAEELAHIQGLLLREPDEAVLRPILQRLAALHQEVGVLAARQTEEEAAVQQERLRRAELDRREEALHQRVLRGEDPAQRVELARQAQRVLVVYEERLRRAKLHEIERQIVACFGRLSRKGTYIARVAVDPQSFETTLFNHHGDPLPKEELSAGEKQLYAIAVLWALRLVSGRAVPLIVDTPLGRLDRDHRTRLVQHYFPQASHQVILLSTDTEVDEALYEELAPAVGRAYHLRYLPREAATQIAPGYFWELSDPDGPETLPL